MFRSSSVIRAFSQYVPQKTKPLVEAQDKFNVFLDNYDKILVLTGAGVSTDSGIPDYRSEDAGMLVKTNYKPVQYSDFVKNPSARQRFWARNYTAWPKFKSFAPNKIHFFIANLQACKPLSNLITQNVDGLHSKAGSRDVLELHGNAFWVRCINCKNTVSRHTFQTVLKNNNPDFEVASLEIRPDADVEIPEESVKNFVVPACEECGGILKPTVVFFGQTVPEKVAKKAEQWVEECDAMLILGTTLTTLSSFRLAEEAYDRGKYICLVNSGPTRGDHFADLRISYKIGDILYKFK